MVKVFCELLLINTCEAGGRGKYEEEGGMWPEALLLTGQTFPVGRGTMAAMLYKDLHVHVNHVHWQFPQTDFVRIANQLNCLLT